MSSNPPDRQPFTRQALDAQLNALGVKPIQVVVPAEERQVVRLLVDADVDVRQLESTLRSRLDRGVLVVKDGPPLHVAHQLLQFIHGDVKFMVQDAYGVMAYVADTEQAQSKARGALFVNVTTFHTFTGGQLSIIPASDAYREMARSSFRVRARGTRDIPGESVDSLLAVQHGLITHDELTAALSVSDEDFSWMVLPEGPQRGSYAFYVPFLNREVDNVYDLIEARLRVLAPLFGLQVDRVSQIEYARKYSMWGESGSVTLKMYYAPSKLKGISSVVPENAALMADSGKLLAPMLAMLHSQLR